MRPPTKEEGEPRGRSVGQKAIVTSLSLYQHDIDSIRAIQDMLGCSKSEAVRTSIRVYLAILKK